MSAAADFEITILGARVQSDVKECSVASGIINSSGNPLLVVKDGGGDLNHLADADRLRALLELDASPASEKCISYLEKLGGGGNVELFLMRAVDPHSPIFEKLKGKERYDALKQAHLGGEALLSSAKKRLEACGYRVSLEVLEGDEADMVCRIHYKNSLDIIIVGKPKIGGVRERRIDSVFHQLFHHCQAHQLIVP